MIARHLVNAKRICRELENIEEVVTYLHALGYLA